MLPLPPRLPRQHGAWVMLALPLLLGLALTRGSSRAAWWAVPGVVLAFLAQDALVQAAHAARRTTAASPASTRGRVPWGLAYLLGAGVCFLALLLCAPAEARPVVLLVAVPSAAAALVWGLHTAAHRVRALWSELIGMAGMALVAPLMAAASGMPVPGHPLGAAATAYLYCLSSVTTVRSYEARRAAPRRAALLGAALHLLLFAAMLLLGRIGAVPRLAPLAFLPVAVRVAFGLARPPKDLRRLGMREIWVAAAFAALCAWAFSISG